MMMLLQSEKLYLEKERTWLTTERRSSPSQKNMWARKRSRFVIQSLIILLISMIILVLMMSMIMQNPPLEEFIKYEKIIESAPAIPRDDLYWQQLLVAEHFRNAALSEWQEQDARWLFLRNYNEARRMMNLAITIAEEVCSTHTTVMNASPLH